MKHASEQENIPIWTKYLSVLHSYLFSIRYFNTIEQFSTECRKTSGIALVFLLNSFL